MRRSVPRAEFKHPVVRGCCKYLNERCKPVGGNNGDAAGHLFNNVFGALDERQRRWQKSADVYGFGLSAYIEMLSESWADEFKLRYKWGLSWNVLFLRE